MDYPHVSITNSTPYSASGTVIYASCSNDDYTVGTGGTWTASSRGACLVTEITAVVNGQNASPYKSSGTSYASFSIIVAPGGFAVTRNTFSDEGEPAGEAK